MRVYLKDLRAIRSQFLDKKIVLVGGTFDLLHPGHIVFLAQAKQCGDILVVAVSTDERVQERKGDKRPIQGQNIRVGMVDAIKYVDYSLILPAAAAKDTYPTIRVIKTLKPDIFISHDTQWGKVLPVINQAGTGFVLDTSRPRNRVHSTSRIIGLIKTKYARG